MSAAQSCGLFAIQVLTAFVILTAPLTNIFGQLPEIDLWNGMVPGPTVPAEPAESQVTAADGLTRRFNVSKPRLFVHLPAGGVKRTGSAVIIVPGGGFARLSDEHEGKDLGVWLASKGIVAFQLAYRTPTSKHSEPNAGPVLDTQKAVIEVRQRAGDYQIDSNRVALLGLSAGGQTALVAASSQRKFDSQLPDDQHRPNLLLLLYPYKILNAKEDAIREDVRIDERFPPTFIAQAADDSASKVQGVLTLYGELLKNKIPAEMHLYEKGGHGYGMRGRVGSTVAKDWPNRAADWLQLHDFLGDATSSL